jgi:hypothetical protein
MQPNFAGLGKNRKYCLNHTSIDWMPASVQFGFAIGHGDRAERLLAGAVGNEIVVATTASAVALSRV